MSALKKKPEFSGLTVGGKKHPLYKARECIIYRCYSVPETKKSVYNTYKGKGIRVCDEWLFSVISFYDWAISAGWVPGLVIDRIDSKGHYEPSNCRFITKSENSKKARSENFQMGEKSSVSVLTNESVREIRRLLSDGFTHRDLAKMFNVGKSTITSINLRQTWLHI